jgi:hypothetical protein
MEDMKTSNCRMRCSMASNMLHALLYGVELLHALLQPVIPHSLSL